MAEDEGQYSLPLAPATPAPSQPNTGRSVSMEALLGDVDTDLDRLGQLLGADGAVRRKAAKRVKRAFGVATSKHLSDALEVALHAQAVKHDAELQRVRSESKRDLNALRAELIGRMAAMAKGASAEEAAAEAEKAKAREARLATMESRLDALAHNLSGFVDHDQKMAKETEEKEQYKALLRERQFDGRAAPDDLFVAEVEPGSTWPDVASAVLSANRDARLVEVGVADLRRLCRSFGEAERTRRFNRLASYVLTAKHAFCAAEENPGFLGWSRLEEAPPLNCSWGFLPPTKYPEELGRCAANDHELASSAACVRSAKCSHDVPWPGAGMPVPG